MPIDPTREIAHALTDAYRSIGSQYGATSTRSLLAEVARIIAIYSETSKVVPIEVVSTDELGLVLTTETALIEGQAKTWKAMHVCRIRAGHVERFEVYGQTLIVVPSGSDPHSGPSFG